MRAHPYLWLALAVGALASYRVTRLVVLDTLWEGWRDRLMRWCFDSEGQYRLVDPPRWGGARTIWALTIARGKLGDLLHCPFCFGVWASAGVVVGEWALGWLPGGRWFPLWIAAVSGGQALLSSADKALNTEP